MGINVITLFKVSLNAIKKHQPIKVYHDKEPLHFLYIFTSTKYMESLSEIEGIN